MKFYSLKFCFVINKINFGMKAFDIFLMLFNTYQLFFKKHQSNWVNRVMPK